MYVLSIYELIKIIQYYIAIKRTPHFGVWSALAPTLNFGGVWITAPALHLLLQKQFFLKNNVYKNLFLQFFYELVMKITV